MIKILTNSPPADNGNKFLCEDCSNGSVRSGTHSQKEILCGFDTAWKKVTFRVTQCSGYTTRSAFKDKAVQAMQRSAWYVDASVEGRGLTIIPPDEAKRRDLFY